MFKKIASNALSQILSKASTALISIFTIGVLTKYFSPEWYGEYNKIYNYLSIFAFLADLGLYTLTIREISKTPEKAGYIVGNMMSLRLLSAIIILFFAVGIAFFLPGYDSKVTLLGILIVGFFTVFNLLNSSVLSLMQGFMKMEWSFVSTLLSRILQVIGMCLVVFVFFPKQHIIAYETPFYWILFAGTIAALCQLILNWWYANRIEKIQFLFDRKYLKKLFFESLPYGVALFLSVVYFKIDIVLLSFLEPKDVANHSIAMYSLPMKIVEVLMVLGVFYLNSLLPSLSEAFHQNNTEKVKHLLTKSFEVLFAFGAFVFVLGSVFQNSIISLIATPDYLHNSEGFASSDVFGIVLGVMVFYFIGSLFNYVLIAAKQEKKLLYVNIFITFVNIIGNMMLIPYLSFVGAGIVTLLSQILLFCILFFITRKYAKIDWHIGKMIQIIFVSLGSYFFFQLILKTFSVNIYVDFFLYGTIFAIFFAGILGYIILGKNEKK